MLLPEELAPPIMLTQPVLILKKGVNHVITFETTFGRHIRHSVELYLMSGRHVTISETKIGSTWTTNSEYAQLDFVPIEKGYFIVRGFKSGKYIQASER